MINASNPCNLTREEAEKALYYSAGTIKFVTGVGNSAAGLRGAIALYEHAVKDCTVGHGLPEKILRHFFHVFDLTPVSTRWERALHLTDPKVDEYDLDEVESRDIQNGLNDLRDRWVNPQTLFGSTIDNIEDYDEMFSTRGHQKKSARTMAELLKETMNELERD